MQFILKALLWQSETFAFTGGLGLNVPTAQDFNSRLVVNDQLQIDPITVVPVIEDIQTTVENSTFNLSPYVAYLWTPQPRVFTQGFLQVDFPLNSSDTVITGTSGTPSDPFILAPVQGAIDQQTLMRINTSVGYWLLQRPQARLLKGWAGVVELHYTTTLENADVNQASIPVAQLQRPPGQSTLTTDVFLGSLSNRSDLLNLTAGSHFLIGERTSLGIAVVVPLRDDDDQAFDCELNVLFNYRI